MDQNVEEVLKPLKKWYFEYKSKDTFNQEYNPWIGNKIGADNIAKFIKELNKEELNKKEGKDFSWLGHEDEKTQQFIPSNYIIPTHVQGDYDNARIFQCLYNPGVFPEMWKKYNNVDEKTNKSTPNELKPTAKEFIDKIDEIEEVEVKEYYNRMFTGNKDLVDKIIQPENVIYQEYQLALALDIQKDKKILYYTQNYYKQLLDKLIELNEENLKKVKELKICNLEYCPFASYRKEDFKLTEKSRVFTNFTAAIIIRRISKHIFCEGACENIRPVFIFRSSDEWIGSIKKFLKDEDVLGDDADKILKFILTKNYFYKFNSQNAMLSKTNISPLRILFEEEYNHFREVFNEIQ